MNAERRRFFEKRLEDERQRSIHLLDRSVGAASEKPDAPGDEPYPGVEGAASIDVAAVLTREALALADINRALQTLREHPERYGVCVSCGGRIDESRLEIVPATTHCARHARNGEYASSSWQLP